MYGQYSLAAVAALVGEPTRAALLLSLLDGRSLPAGELARAVKLSAAATSLHLGKLTRGGLLSVRQEGRHRYYRLASAEVAHALEALGVIATAPVAVQGLSPERRALRTARSCYDHLAGSLAVELATALERAQLILPRRSRAVSVTPRGQLGLSRLFGSDTQVRTTSQVR